MCGPVCVLGSPASQRTNTNGKRETREIGEKESGQRKEGIRRKQLTRILDRMGMVHRADFLTAGKSHKGEHGRRREEVKY